MGRRKEDPQRMLGSPGYLRGRGVKPRREISVDTQPYKDVHGHAPRGVRAEPRVWSFDVHLDPGYHGSVTTLHGQGEYRNVLARVLRSARVALGGTKGERIIEVLP